MKNKKRRGDIILLIAGSLCLIVFVVTGCLLLNYWYESYKQAKMNLQLAELKHGKQSEILYVEAEPVTTPVMNQAEVQETQNAETTQTEPEHQQEQEVVLDLTNINPDYMMWLQIADTEIDYPVVQRDNAYYLKHDFYGKRSNHGTIFLDESCDAKGSILLLHGHHMKDGTMFGSLKNYKKEDYRKQHSVLTLDRMGKVETYEVFAGALIDLLKPERFCYEELPEGEEETKAYLQQLKNAAFWYEEPQWEGEEQLVILSTCDYGTKEQRMIVVAVEKK